MNEEMKFFRASDADATAVASVGVPGDTPFADRKPIEDLTGDAERRYIHKYCINEDELVPELELENILEVIRYYAKFKNCFWSEASRLAASVLGGRYGDMPYLKLALMTSTDPLAAALRTGLDNWSRPLYGTTVKFVDKLQNDLGLWKDRDLIDLEGDGSNLVPEYEGAHREEVLAEFRRDLYFIDQDGGICKSYLAKDELGCGFFDFRRDSKNSKHFFIDCNRSKKYRWSSSCVEDEVFPGIFRNYSQTAAKGGHVVIAGSDAIGNYRKHRPRILMLVDEVVKPFNDEDFNAVSKFVENGKFMNLL